MSSLSRLSQWHIAWEGGKRTGHSGESSPQHQSDPWPLWHKRWSLPERMRSTPEYKCVHPSWATRERASFNDRNHTKKLTRFVANYMNGTGSVQDTCVLRVLHITLHVATSMSRATCHTQYKKIPVAQPPHQWWQKDSTPVLTWLPDSMWHHSTCDNVLAEHMSSESATYLFRDCLFKKTSPATLRTCLRCGAAGNISWITSFATRLRIDACNIRIKVSANSPSTLYQALCFRVVSMQCVTCLIPDRLSLKRDTVWRWSHPIHDTGLNDVMRFFSCHFECPVGCVTAQSAVDTYVPMSSD